MKHQRKYQEARSFALAFLNSGLATNALNLMHFTTLCQCAEIIFECEVTIASRPSKRTAGRLVKTRSLLEKTVHELWGTSASVEYPGPWPLVTVKSCHIHLPTID